MPTKTKTKQNQNQNQKRRCTVRFFPSFFPLVFLGGFFWVRWCRRPEVIFDPAATPRYHQTGFRGHCIKTIDRCWARMADGRGSRQHKVLEAGCACLHELPIATVGRIHTPTVSLLSTTSLNTTDLGRRSPFVRTGACRSVSARWWRSGSGSLPQ